MAMAHAAAAPHAWFSNFSSDSISLGGYNPQDVPGPESEESAGWLLYFLVVSFATTLQVVSVASLMLVAKDCFQFRFMTSIKSPKVIKEKVAVVVPIYLPNEAPIIEQTIRHVLNKLESIDLLDLYIVYNTPHDMPIECELQLMAQETHPPGRQLFVERVHGSTSKADNLNYIIPKISTTYLVIYDADHHPDPNSLALAVAHLKTSGVDCVQGSTYIREGNWFFKGVVCAEFFVTYFALLPVMQLVSGTAFFGGANAVWLTASLQRLSFDTSVLTEDIDCFCRAYLEYGLTFDFLPECCSGELLPSSFKAFWKQRLRWSMGWDQVTVQHVPEFWTSSLSLRKRIGLYYIFVCRWFTQIGVLVITVFNAWSGIYSLVYHKDSDAPIDVRNIQRLSLCLYLVFIAFTMIRGIMHKPSLVPYIALYFVCMPVNVFFGAFLIIVSLFRIASGNIGGWVVTSRSGVSSVNPSTEEPLLSIEKPSVKTEKKNSGVGVLAVGFFAMGIFVGSVIGAAVGAVLGQRQVVKPAVLWGMRVPFGIGQTTVTVIDGSVIVKGMFVGMFISLLLVHAMHFRLKRSTCIHYR